ncbi:MAG: hypothetical protein LBN27_00155 [Prevotellaceae bacterium]|jgi:hypothetical protein|nr:hypothetical protein [Prevotellaceae bacterium]
MKKITIPALLVLFALSFAACNKDEGKGGTSTLHGYVYKVIHNDDNYLMTVDTFPAAKTDVYLVYGSDHFYGDDAEAAPDGFYQFKYLTKGNYTVFAYSELANGERVAVEQSVKIGSGTATAQNIYIHTGKAYGTAMVRGQVEIRFWDKNGPGFVDEINPIAAQILPKYAADIRVYIRRAGESFYFDDVRTDENGIFIFQKLQPGTYEIFTYSADVAVLSRPTLAEKVNIPVKTTIKVTETGKMYDLSEALKIVDTL